MKTTGSTETLIFATGNQRKITEASRVLARHNIAFTTQRVETDEIQHPDSSEIAKAKAIAAYAEVQHPVVVSDTSWGIPALGGFPGGYMKDIGNWWKAEDWLAVMARHQDKRILCYEHVAFYDGVDLQHFMTAYTGSFIHELRGREDPNESFERVVVLYGDATMAEQLERGEVASAGEDLAHWEQFARWYAGR